MVVPSRFVRRQLFVARSPLVAGPRMSIDDQRRHVEHLEPGAERQAALPPADNDDERLLGDPDGRAVCSTLIEPIARVIADAVFSPAASTSAGPLLEPLEFLQRGQERGAEALGQPNVAGAAP